MSRAPILPQSPHPPDSYDGRLRYRLEHELQAQAASIALLHDGRLGGVLALSAAPTSGTYAVGDIVRNSAPTELGGAGSKYVLLGWIVSSASPLTFLEIRTLTGN